MISFADRSRQIPTRPTSTNADQHVLADTSHASEYQSEYQYNTSDFDCHTPRTEDAKASPGRDRDRNTSEMKPSGSAPINSGHDGPAAVKAAPAARRFAVH